MFASAPAVAIWAVDEARPLPASADTDAFHASACDIAITMFVEVGTSGTTAFEAPFNEIRPLLFEIPGEEIVNDGWLVPAGAAATMTVVVVGGGDGGTDDRRDDLVRDGTAEARHHVEPGMGAVARWTR